MERKTREQRAADRLARDLDKLAQGQKASAWSAMEALGLTGKPQLSDVCEALHRQAHKLAEDSNEQSCRRFRQAVTAAWVLLGTAQNDYEADVVEMEGEG